MQCRRRRLDQAGVSGTVLGRLVAPLLRLSLDFLARRPTGPLSGKCALHPEKSHVNIHEPRRRQWPRAGSLRRKIFSDARRVKACLGEWMCLRAVCGDQKTSIMKNRRVSTSRRAHNGRPDGLYLQMNGVKATTRVWWSSPATWYFMVSARSSGTISISVTHCVGRLSCAVRHDNTDCPQWALQTFLTSSRLFSLESPTATDVQPENSRPRALERSVKHYTGWWSTKTWLKVQ